MSSISIGCAAKGFELLQQLRKPALSFPDSLEARCHKESAHIAARPCLAEAQDPCCEGDNVMCGTHVARCMFFRGRRVQDVWACGVQHMACVVGTLIHLV